MHIRRKPQIIKFHPIIIGTNFWKLLVIIVREKKPLAATRKNRPDKALKSLLVRAVYERKQPFFCFVTYSKIRETHPKPLSRRSS